MGAMEKIIVPELRHKYDQIFMQVISSAQADVQATGPQSAGSIAQMFHREQVSSVLQNLATLIAGWNEGKINLNVAEKCSSTLRALGLEATADRINALHKIDEV